MALLRPEEFTLSDIDGNPITVVLSRFPATIGEEILIKFPMNGLPKVGDYEVFFKTGQEIMAYVGIPQENGMEPLALKTRALVDNHIPDGETLMKIKYKMVEYNSTFLQPGKVSGFLDALAQTAVAKFIAMLAPLREQSSAQEPQPSMNSAPSTI
jgi:hypothetical protein